MTKPISTAQIRLFADGLVVMRYTHDIYGRCICYQRGDVAALIIRNPRGEGFLLLRASVSFSPGVGELWKTVRPLRYDRLYNAFLFARAVVGVEPSKR